MDESALERYFDDSIANVSKDIDSSDLMLLSMLKLYLTSQVNMQSFQNSMDTNMFDVSVKCLPHFY